MNANILQDGMHRCPAHPDRRASLSVRRARDGRWLLHDFAGCDTETILAAAGLTFADLFPTDSPRPARVPRRHHWRDEIERPLIARERRILDRLHPYLDIFKISDVIRERRRDVCQLRRVAGSWGDVDDAWGVLALAADEEREVNVLEAEADAVLGAIK